MERLVKLAESPGPTGCLRESPSEEFSRILQDLRIGDVWKWTWRHRLVGMDRLLSEYAAGQGWRQLRMLDIGASDGITALDTVEYIKATNKIPVVITTVERDTRVLCVARRGVTLYFTPSSRRPFLVRLGCFALFLEPMQGLEGFLFNKRAERLGSRYARILEREDITHARAISLINPAVRRCAEIEICERNLFDPEPAWRGAYDAVRASNVLNLAYYPEARIREALGLLHGYLREGGALLASRNVIGGRGETELGALWRKQGNVFTRISSLQQLPEIAGVIDTFSCA
ncbi:MAG: hypothetical protein NTV49_00315 [Kiritimatiellaeota bacterium]|nr:hypothetical protein [Kiritimatiellota bacterium]